MEETGPHISKLLRLEKWVYMQKDRQLGIKISKFSLFLPKWQYFHFYHCVNQMPSIRIAHSVHNCGRLGISVVPVIEAGRDKPMKDKSEEYIDPSAVDLE